MLRMLSAGWEGLCYQLPLSHSPKVALTGHTQASGATRLQVKHSHPRESCKWGILLSFALKEVPLKSNCTLIRAILLLGRLAAQNVGIGTNAPTQRLHVAGNLHLDNAFMPGNQAGAIGKTLLSQEAGATPQHI